MLVWCIVSEEVGKKSWASRNSHLEGYLSMAFLLSLIWERVWVGGEVNWELVVEAVSSISSSSPSMPSSTITFYLATVRDLAVTSHSCSNLCAHIAAVREVASCRSSSSGSSSTPKKLSRSCQRLIVAVPAMVELISLKTSRRNFWEWASRRSDNCSNWRAYKSKRS